MDMDFLSSIHDLEDVISWKDRKDRKYEFVITSEVSLRR